MKRRGKVLQAYHQRPLPVVLATEVHGNLPQLFPHNPVSWANFLWRLVVIYSHGAPVQHKVRLTAETVVAARGKLSWRFFVADQEDMTTLWRDGFFGKGTLSRSEPNWAPQTGGGEPVMRMEDVTWARRVERRKFKELRAQVQRMEAEERARELTPEEKQSLESWKAEMKGDGEKLPVAAENTDLIEQQNAPERPVNHSPDSPNESVAETLQLLPCEAFFLAFALDAVVCRFSLGDLFQMCMQTPDFLAHYAAYHHYRSLGWCVRSGVKFGCTFLLYKRGPPFGHAEFGVVVRSEPETIPAWEDLSATARVVGGVKKILVTAYVSGPQTTKICETREQFREYLRELKITEIVNRRWAPNRTRD